MQVQATPDVSDEITTYQYRWSSFMKYLNEIDASLSVTTNGDATEFDSETVSILNLPSLKRGDMASKSPLAKLESIRSDKHRLSVWMTNYKNVFLKSSIKDSVKIATFREAATRLKMLLDHSDFDEGSLRDERRKAILEINNMLQDINKL